MLSETLLAQGSKIIHVPAGSSLTLLPQVSATLYQVINKPNHPTLNKYIIEIFNQEYLTDIVSTDVDYLIIAGNGFVNYQIDYAPLHGVATLSGGTTTINVSIVTANSIVALTPKNANSGTLGIYTYSIIPNTSITVTSSEPTDVSTFSWFVTNL